MKRIAALLLALLTLITPCAAYASPQDGYEDDFSDSDIVSNKELDTQRGGAINIRGVNFDFTYLSRIRVLNQAHNIDHVQNTVITAADIQAGSQLPNVLIVQNALDGSYIGIEQALDVVAQGLPARIEANNLATRLASSRQFR